MVSRVWNRSLLAAPQHWVKQAFVGAVCFALLFWGMTAWAGTTEQPMVTIFVTSAANSGPGTLREALTNAGPNDVIQFSTVVFPPSSPTTIFLTTELPIIATSNLLIDASNAGVILNGQGLPYESSNCLVVENASNVSIRGLQVVSCRNNGLEVRGSTSNITIGGNRLTGSAPTGQGNRFSGNKHGIYVTGSNSVVILGNIVGTNVSGTAKEVNLHSGIVVTGTTTVAVGSLSPGESNLISGNGDPSASYSYGLEIWRSGSALLMGNYVGTNLAGNAPLGNAHVGILMVDSGSAHVEGNWVSDNGRTGLVIERLNTAVIHNNTVGVDLVGNAAMGNNDHGIFVLDVPYVELTDNLVSGNAGSGVILERVSDSIAFNNKIGTNRSGTAALNNGGLGLRVVGANFSVGGVGVNQGNLLSGNGQWAALSLVGNGTGLATIQGNRIGVNLDGNAGLGNLGSGIHISATNVLIGGLEATASNLISGNGGHGVVIESPSFPISATILNNYIGTDIQGTTRIGNGHNGILITDFNMVTIRHNVISGNGAWAGISLRGGNVNSYAVIQDNKLGVDVTGTIELRNLGSGIYAEKTSFSTLKNRVQVVKQPEQVDKFHKWRQPKNS